MMPGTGKGLFIAGRWQAGHGHVFVRHDPAEGRLAWEGNAADGADVALAVDSARKAVPAWARLSWEQRCARVEAFGRAVEAHREDFVKVISLETGRPYWEVRMECDALINKIGHTKRAFSERQAPSTAVKDGLSSVTRFKPLGVVTVLGPFNLPAHLPNGHIIPAVLAGNAVVFKPSELTPGVGELYARCWQEADLPAGVFNMIQGGREQGAALTVHPEVNGVLFTGSRAAGIALSKSIALTPEKLLALEMGGNNPLMATGVADPKAAAYAIVQSSFITSGQRCTCARRLILMRDTESDRILAHTLNMAKNIRVGTPAAVPEPFMGPVISEAAAEQLRRAYAELVNRGALPLLPLGTVGSRSTMLTAAILDVTGMRERTDEELFGPILQVIRVDDVDAALAEASASRFGLAAALLSNDAALFERFYAAVAAGVINWNRSTTGASSGLPFGGVGWSGNHRPAGAYAADYCSDPVASLESPTLALPATPVPGICL
jgi:succinylglutamic semialdehyde dehydrogenase